MPSSRATVDSVGQWNANFRDRQTAGRHRLVEALGNKPLKSQKPQPLPGRCGPCHGMWHVAVRIITPYPAVLMLFLNPAANCPRTVLHSTPYIENIYGQVFHTYTPWTLHCFESVPHDGFHTKDTFHRNSRDISCRGIHWWYHNRNISTPERRPHLGFQTVQKI